MIQLCALVLMGGLLFPSQGMARAEEVTLSTADGITLSGTYFPPQESKRPAVLLLHDLGRDRSDWEDLAEELQQEGYAVLTLDLRGHGKSNRQGSEALSYRSMSDSDFGKAIQDVQAAYQYLSTRKDVDAGKIALGGAGLGANLGLKFAAQERRLKTLLLLSPGLSIKGLQALEDMDRYGERPVLLAASLQDSAAADAVRHLEKVARGRRRVKVYEGAGHGVEMLEKEQDLVDLILDWLHDTL